MCRRDTRDILERLQSGSILDEVFRPTRLICLHQRILGQRRGLGLDDFSDGAGAHGLAGADGWNIETIGRLSVGRDPAALGGVVGEELGAEEDLSILNRRQIGRLDRKGGIGAVEDGFTDNLAVEHPLASLSGKRHGVCVCVCVWCQLDVRWRQERGH